MERLWQDLRYGLRVLAKNPGFTAVAVLTLALGIGANTAVFTLINALMLRSLPVEKPQQLHFFGEDNSGGSYDGDLPTGSLTLFSYHFYKEFRERNAASFEDVAAFSSTQVTLRVAGLRSGDLPRRVEGALVTGNYFRLLGVNTVLGRTLGPEDDREGDPRAVAVISYDYWTQNMGRDSNVVGKTLEIDRLPFTLVGVAPPDFFGVKLVTDPPDFWIPLGWQPQAKAEPSRLTNLDSYWLDVFGRLKPGVNTHQVQAAITGQAQQLLTTRHGSHLDTEARRRIQQAYVQLVPGARGLSGLRARFSERLRVLSLLVVLVLVIACLNVANLLLARSTARQREIAIRLAVGAGRGRLTRQLLTESVLLACLGGLGGLLLAFWGTAVLSALVFGHSVSLPFSLHPDAHVLGFTFLVSVLTGIAFGLAPALRSARTDLNSSLKDAGRRAGATAPGLVRFAPGKLLISGQVMVSLALLVVAGLFVRSLRNLMHQNLGFSPEHVLVCRLDIGAAGYKPEQLPALYQRLLDRVRALPGVRSAALADRSVLGHSTHTSNLSIQGRTPKGQDTMMTERKTVSDSYFETDGMALLAGRPITRNDTKDSPAVAVINQAFAEQYFPHENPLGHHFNYGSPFSPPGLEIVGVVADAKYDSLSDVKAAPMTFVPVDQELGPGAYADDLELRVAGDPASAAQDVRRAIADIDRNIMVASVHPLRELVDQAAHGARLIAQLSSFFGLLALLLATIGLYGLMAYSVLRRTGEISVRMALGADSTRVLRMVLGESLVVAVTGVLFGVPVSLGLGRLVSSQLFGLSPSDPVTLVIAALLMLGVSALAGYVPAHRAAKVDPMVALRYE